MGHVIKGPFGDRALVSPMEAWQVDLDNISVWETERYLMQIARCPDPVSDLCIEYLEGVLELRHAQRLARGNSGEKTDEEDGKEAS